MIGHSPEETMANCPDRHEQIRIVHADFIRQVVETCQNPESKQDFEALLYSAAENGWSDLVRAIRRISAGEQEQAAFARLDEEDQVIARAILRGIQDPSTLPDARAKPNPAVAAPGLAHMIHAAATGNAQALMLVGNMAEQMSTVGGNMGRLAAIIRPLIDGERDPDRLCKGMDAQGESLVLGILGELGRLEAH
jgi:hypothetical protein